jgi:hypothetical protein
VAISNCPRAEVIPRYTVYDGAALRCRRTFGRMSFLPQRPMRTMTLSRRVILFHLRGLMNATIKQLAKNMRTAAPFRYSGPQAGLCQPDNRDRTRLYMSNPS